jgi:D-alanyl-D-alanine carboxypeptidase
MVRSSAASRLTQFLDDWLSYRAQARTMPGFSVAITKGEGVIYQAAFGFANMAQQEVLQTDHAMYIGSQSKMMTAILAMQLVEAGKLALHDRVIKYLPWLGDRADPRFRFITIEQLLWHGSGLLRDGQDAGFWQLLKPFPDAATLQNMILGSDLVIDSAKEVKYSNVGYALLGQVIEGAGGASYEQQALQRVIEPLHLCHTAVTHVAPTKITMGYTQHIGGRRYEINPYVPVNTYQSVVGWQSTPEDMGKIMISLYGNDETLVSDAAKRRLIRGNHTHWRPPGPGREEYGMGFIQQRLGNQQLYGHAGAFITHRSCSYFNPRTKVGVAIMANSNDAPVNEIAAGMFDVIEHFEQYAEPTPQALQRYDVLLESMLGVKQILAIGDQLEAVSFEDWFPFDGVESLKVVDDHTLQVSRSSFLAVKGEAILYEFQGNKVRAVNYAGMPCWPRDDFIAQFRAQHENKK